MYIYVSAAFAIVNGLFKKNSEHCYFTWGSEYKCFKMTHFWIIIRNMHGFTITVKMYWNELMVGRHDHKLILTLFFSLLKPSYWQLLCEISHFKTSVFPFWKGNYKCSNENSEIAGNWKHGRYISQVQLHFCRHLYMYMYIDGCVIVIMYLIFHVHYGALSWFLVLLTHTACNLDGPPLTNWQ